MDDQVGRALVLAAGGQRDVRSLGDYAAAGAFAVLPLGRFSRCFLGPFSKRLGALGFPALSLAPLTVTFGELTDSFDGPVGGSDGSATGFGFLPNGLGFPGGVGGGLVTSDVASERPDVPAEGFVFCSSAVLGVASV